MSTASTAGVAGTQSLTVVSERHSISRERFFLCQKPSRDILLELLDALRDEHLTGKVTINLSQGSIQNVQVEERQKIFSPAP